MFFGLLPRTRAGGTGPSPGGLPRPLRRNPMICASVNHFFTPDLPFRMIGLSTEVLLKMGGRRALNQKSRSMTS